MAELLKSFPILTFTTGAVFTAALVLYACGGCSARRGQPPATRSPTQASAREAYIDPETKKMLEELAAIETRLKAIEEEFADDAPAAAEEQSQGQNLDEPTQASPQSSVRRRAR